MDKETRGAYFADGGTEFLGVRTPRTREEVLSRAKKEEKNRCCEVAWRWKGDWAVAAEQASIRNLWATLPPVRRKGGGPHSATF